MRSSRLVLNTGVGTIEIRLQDTQAPQTTRFVRQLVEAGHFDGAAFYRSTTLGVDGRHGLIQAVPLLRCSPQPQTRFRTSRCSTRSNPRTRPD